MKTQPPHPNIFHQLRTLVPDKRLSETTARRIIAAQAGRLRELLDLTGPAVPDSSLARLARIEIRYEDLPSSALAHWELGRWLIIINATDPHERQRFSLAHELFHIINYWTGPRLHPGTPWVSARTQAERLADYFAGCLLMPGAEITRLAHAGATPQELAKAFEVSVRAIGVRLSQLGLTGPTVRCLTPQRSAPRRRQVAA